MSHEEWSDYTPVTGTVTGLLLRNLAVLID